jgi:transcriptional regulator with GAF, ATPase, and Fis domain
MSRSSNQSGVSRPILGASAPIKRLIAMIEKVAPTKTNILVIGESGTGKELIAKMIHESGPLKGKPFVPVNCGAIPETLIESEMFGHRRGSFTGAVSEKQGLFEVAHGGTLFLDEVGELPLSMQVKLLRAIQERSFRKVGGTEDIKVDVRIIAATNRDLEIAVTKGTFREDLFYRLNVIQLKSPPLRERPGDIQILAEAFLKKFSERAGKSIQGMTPEALNALQCWNWPGNVRELENVMERGVTLEMESLLSLSSLPSPLSEALGQFSLKASPQSMSSGNQTSSSTNIPEVGRSNPPGATVLGIQLPSVTYFSDGAPSIELKKVTLEIEKSFYLAAKRVAEKNDVELARILGLNQKELKSLEKRMQLND